jgi:hypothetical protein
MKSLTLSIDEQLHRDLRIAAAHAEMSLSGFVSHLIVERLAGSSQLDVGRERSTGFFDRDAQSTFRRGGADPARPAAADPAGHCPSQSEALDILRSLVRAPLTDADGRAPTADERRR